MAAAGKIHRRDCQRTAELRAVTRATAKNMWPKLVTAAEKYAELWALHHH